MRGNTWRRGRLNSSAKQSANKMTGLEERSANTILDAPATSVGGGLREVAQGSRGEERDAGTRKFPTHSSRR